MRFRGVIIGVLAVTALGSSVAFVATRSVRPFAAQLTGCQGPVYSVYSANNPFDTAFERIMRSSNSLWFLGGQNIAEISTSGTITHNYPMPHRAHSVTLGADGKIWGFYGDSTDPLGELNKPFSMTSGGQITAITTPLAVGAFTTGPDGNVWFVNQTAGNVEFGKITPAGVVTKYPTTYPSTSAFFDIAPGPDGRLWFVSEEGHLGKITTSGAVTYYQFPQAGDGGERIAAGADGNMWVAMNRGIGKVTTSGVVTVYPFPVSSQDNGGSEEIALGPDGNMWFTFRGEAAVYRITPQGVMSRYDAPEPVTALVSGPDNAVWLMAPQGETINGRIVRMTPCPGGTATSSAGTSSSQRGNSSSGDGGGDISFCGPVCGDGTVTDSEECDDGNTANNDGCSSRCETEPGWDCEAESVCNPVCGDGITAETEYCDDGNTIDGDGCPADCGRVVTGSSSSGQSSNQSSGASQSSVSSGHPAGPACGDGTRDPGEECDDGDTVSGDGCSDVCEVETGWRCEDPALRRGGGSSAGGNPSGGTACTVCGSAIPDTWEWTVAPNTFSDGPAASTQDDFSLLNGRTIVFSRYEGSNAIFPWEGSCAWGGEYVGAPIQMQIGVFQAPAASVPGIALWIDGMTNWSMVLPAGNADCSIARTLQQNPNVSPSIPVPPTVQITPVMP